MPTGKQPKGPIKKAVMSNIHSRGRAPMLAGIMRENVTEIHQFRVAHRYWSGTMSKQLGNQMTRFKIEERDRASVYAFGHNFLLTRRPKNDPIAPGGFRTPTIEELRKVFPFLKPLYLKVSQKKKK